MTTSAEQYLYDRKLDPELLFAQVALMNQMLDVSGIDVPAALEAARAVPRPFSESRIRDYSAISLFAKDYGVVEEWSSRTLNGRYYDLFIDAPTAVALTYKDVPQALIAMRAVSRHSASVVQIQGIRPIRVAADGTFGAAASARGLMPLHWTTCMLHIGEQIARLAGTSSLYVESGTNNRWARPGKRSDLGFPYEAAYRNYDQAAKNFGYSYDKRTARWKKGLPKIKS